MLSKVGEVVFGIHELMESLDAMELMKDIQRANVVGAPRHGNTNLVPAVMLVIFGIYSYILTWMMELETRKIETGHSETASAGPLYLLFSKSCQALSSSADGAPE